MKRGRSHLDEDFAPVRQVAGERINYGYEELLTMSTTTAPDYLIYEALYNNTGLKKTLLAIATKAFDTALEYDKEPNTEIARVLYLKQMRYTSTNPLQSKKEVDTYREQLLENGKKPAWRKEENTAQLGLLALESHRGLKKHFAKGSVTNPFPEQIELADPTKISFSASYEALDDFVTWQMTTLNANESRDSLLEYIGKEYKKFIEAANKELVRFIANEKPKQKMKMDYSIPRNLIDLPFLKTFGDYKGSKEIYDLFIKVVQPEHIKICMQRQGYIIKCNKWFTGINKGYCTSIIIKIASKIHEEGEKTMSNIYFAYHLAISVRGFLDCLLYDLATNPFMILADYLKFFVLLAKEMEASMMELLRSEWKLKDAAKRFNFFFDMNRYIDNIQKNVLFSKSKWQETSMQMDLRNITTLQFYYLDIAKKDANQEDIFEILRMMNLEHASYYHFPSPEQWDIISEKVAEQPLITWKTIKRKLLSEPQYESGFANELFFLGSVQSGQIKLLQLVYITKRLKKLKTKKKDKPKPKKDKPKKNKPKKDKPKEKKKPEEESSESDEEKPGQKRSTGKLSIFSQFHETPITHERSFLFENESSGSKYLMTRKEKYNENPLTYFYHCKADLIKK